MDFAVVQEDGEILTCNSAFSSTVMVWFSRPLKVVNARRANRERRIGVLWSGDHMFPRIPETIKMLRQKGRSDRHVLPYGMADSCKGKQLVFVTNNSTKSRADYKKKFDKMNIEAYEARTHH